MDKGSNLCVKDLEVKPGSDAALCEPGTSSSASSAAEVGNSNNGGDKSGRSSPDPTCAICLGNMDNKSFTNSCMHQFCFNCLKQWSKVKAQCPLCKQNFKSIYYNIRTIDDFQEYVLPTSTGISIADFAREDIVIPRFFGGRVDNAVSSYLDYVVRLEEGMNRLPQPSSDYRRRRTLFEMRRREGTMSFRRNIYQQGLWSQPLADVTGRVRESSPEFYRANPAMVHRLAPWLNRELNVLCNADVQNVMALILDLITRVPIRSPAFSSHISTYLGRHTEHFVYEFYRFATTPYDLVGYDREASYGPRRSLPHEVVDIPSSSSSDDETIPRERTPDPIDVASDSDDCVIVDSVPPPRPRTPEVITVESDDEVVQINISFNPNRPGPSRAPRTSTVTSNMLNVSINIGCQGQSCSSSPAARMNAEPLGSEAEPGCSGEGAHKVWSSRHLSRLAAGSSAVQSFYQTAASEYSTAMSQSAVPSSGRLTTGPSYSGSNQNHLSRLNYGAYNDVVFSSSSSSSSDSDSEWSAVPRKPIKIRYKKKLNSNKISKENPFKKASKSLSKKKGPDETKKEKTKRPKKIKSPNLPLKKRKLPNLFPSSSDDEPSVLQIDVEPELVELLDPDDVERKPRLKSVVVKPEVNTKIPDVFDDSSSSSRADLPHIENKYSMVKREKVSCDSSTSNGSDSNSYGHSSHRRKKKKHHKKTSKRDK